jgi:hypothetical protein
LAVGVLVELHLATMKMRMIVARILSLEVNGDDYDFFFALGWTVFLLSVQNPGRQGVPGGNIMRDLLRQYVSTSLI